MGLSICCITMAMYDSRLDTPGWAEFWTTRRGLYKQYHGQGARIRGPHIIISLQDHVQQESRSGKIIYQEISKSARCYEKHLGGYHRLERQYQPQRSLVLSKNSLRLFLASLVRDHAPTPIPPSSRRFSSHPPVDKSHSPILSLTPPMLSARALLHWS